MLFSSRPHELLVLPMDYRPVLLALTVSGCATPPTPAESVTSQCIATVLIGAGAQDLHATRTKDVTAIEYFYRSTSGERRRSLILLNNDANFDGSYLYRNPSDISYGGPLTLAVEDALETRCHALGYDVTM